MGFGLLSIFLPLYMIAIGGSLIQIGLMSSMALFLAIPASFFWGYICDKTKRYKRYILMSFLASTAILYLFTLTTNANLLILLYAVMSIVHVAHEPPKNVLIAELYSRRDWERSFAFYEGFTEVGWLIGLLLGFLVSACSIGPVNTLLLCAVLNLVAFVLSAVFVTDPLLIFERGLVNMEKSVDFTYRGIFLASKILDGVPTSERLRRENVGAFCVGLILFSLATSILFTPMPVFVSNAVAKAGLSQSIVFMIFVLNSGGAILGYFLAGRRSQQSMGKSRVAHVAIVRSILSLILIVCLQSFQYNVILATAILMLMGLAYALFIVCTLSLSMELIPAGRAGMFNVLIGIGGACGSYIGPFLADAFSFTYVFVTAGLIFLASYLTFRLLM